MRVKIFVYYGTKIADAEQEINEWLRSKGIGYPNSMPIQVVCCPVTDQVTGQQISMVTYTITTNQEP